MKVGGERLSTFAVDCIQYTELKLKSDDMESDQRGYLPRPEGMIC
ncbi:hypothetical protein SAMN05192551_105199 [Tindallia magadiensis]|uniref:Uncharacterized protein n=1 Tax=Tindallia magadiensis TaxID=69895 RepID=A0A1I3EVS2_9FIRM|nr:hypothetical protein SAMN05192551_105199 [Tindallia magadiensis]